MPYPFLVNILYHSKVMYNRIVWVFYIKEGNKCGVKHVI